jgi:hypothetical protein
MRMRMRYDLLAWWSVGTRIYHHPHAGQKNLSTAYGLTYRYDPMNDIAATPAQRRQTNMNTDDAVLV